MRSQLISALILFVVWSCNEIDAIPLNSAIWHKISKRDTVQTPTGDTNQNNSSKNSIKGNEQSQNSASQDRPTDGGDDAIIEAQPEMSATENENSEKMISDVGDANADRSIDWQFLSGNPADLERELESRRRRRSVRSSSLSRQHRIRTAGRSRAKRGIYYDTGITPSDILAAYSYLQSRLDERNRYEDVNDGDLANLASLIYELQRPSDGAVDVDDDQQVLPAGYVEIEPTNYSPTEVRLNPEQLAALEQFLSEQQAEEIDDDRNSFPKDKRAMRYDDQDDVEENNDEGDDGPTYLVPLPIDPSAEYVQIPIAPTYENPYDFYQVDDNANLYDEDATRRFDEEQLRQRIASLIDDINEQRQVARLR